MHSTRMHDEGAIAPAVGHRFSTSRPPRQLAGAMVGILVLMWGIGVCSGASRAATIPAGSVAFGKYVKVGSADYITGHELACQPGSDFCGPHSTWNYQTHTCEGANLGLTTMQSFTAADCNKFATPTGTGYIQVGVLTDERDGTAYVIRKYADGHCWMAENLKFGNNCTATTFSSSDVATTGYVGTYQDHAYRGLCRLSATNYDGYLYNWEAVMNNSTAAYKSTYVAHNDSNAFSNGATLATHDICPLGWHVPKSTEFQAVADSVQGSSVAYHCTSSDCAISWNFFRTATANNWNASGQSILAGYARGGAVNSQGSLANWWSSTSINTNAAYCLRLVTENISPQYGDPRYGGYFVRCLADY